MRGLTSLVVLISIFSLPNIGCAGDHAEFIPAYGVSAVVDIADDLISVHVVDQRLDTKQFFDLDVDREQAVHIAIQDYDFDGRIDFSVWYLDEGMGAYTIHRLFLYSKGENYFLEYLPRCGDAFINLRIDSAKKHLVSTYFDNNMARICVSRP